MAFEMGRHIIGYEIQKVLAAVDWFCKDTRDAARIGVWGYGEGGMLALYAAAIDERIEHAEVSGYFGPRENVWQEPIYRNIWGLLREFGDAELACLIGPRTVAIEGSAFILPAPPTARAGRTGGAPGQGHPVTVQGCESEDRRRKEI